MMDTPMPAFYYEWERSEKKATREQFETQFPWGNMEYPPLDSEEAMN